MKIRTRGLIRLKHCAPGRPSGGSVWQMHTSCRPPEMQGNLECWPSKLRCLSNIGCGNREISDPGATLAGVSIALQSGRVTMAPTFAPVPRRIRSMRRSESVPGGSTAASVRHRPDYRTARRAPHGLLARQFRFLGDTMGADRVLLSGVLHGSESDTGCAAVGYRE